MKEVNLCHRPNGSCCPKLKVNDDGSAEITDDKKTCCCCKKGKKCKCNHVCSIKLTKEQYRTLKKQIKKEEL